MKKVIFIQFFIFACVMGAFAQLKVLGNGNVGIKSSGNTNYTTDVNAENALVGVYVYRSGNNLYALLVDGKEVDVKRMILTE